MIAFGEYLADPPLLHTWDDARNWNIGGFSADHLQLIHSLASAIPEARIIETGAGNSSITFLYTRPARLLSVALDESVFRRIEEYCSKAGIDTSRWHRIFEQSETALPKLMLSEKPQFDIALLDGGHGMPTVFVDFVYMHARLKVGGLLLIDDVQLHSVKELARLLANEPGFTLVGQMNKLAVFRKEWDREFIGDFGNQGYVIEQTVRYASYPDRYALTVPSITFLVRHRFNSIVKSIVRPFVRHIVHLAESSLRLAPPSVSKKIYQMMRSAYYLLPVRSERKAHWAHRVIRGSAVLSGIALTRRKAAATLSETKANNIESSCLR
jgi:predicted O-methyltransferase YrrM